MASIWDKLKDPESGLRSDIATGADLVSAWSGGRRDDASDVVPSDPETPDWVIPAALAGGLLILLLLVKR